MISIDNYNRYLELYNKMNEIKALFDEIIGMNPDIISDEILQRIHSLSQSGSYDKECNITDIYFIDEGEYFELFEEMNIADEVRDWFSCPDFDLFFCVSFYFNCEKIRVDYYKDVITAIEQYESALQKYKEWVDEDQEDGGRKRLYNILVIEESQNEFRKDTETDEWVYCWQEREIIRTDFEDKFYAKVVEIQENANRDYYQTKIFIDLNSGEEVILFNGLDIETERTDRATFYLRRLGLDTQ